MRRVKVLLTKEDGFTLFELLTVALIMIVLMGISAFAITNYQRAQRLTGAARQMHADMRDAQIRAQAEVTTYKVVFDKTNEKYEVWKLVGPGAADYEKKISVQLEAGNDLVEADFGTDGEVAYFYPRGTSSDGKVTIYNPRVDQDRVIEVTGLTSRVELK